MTYEEYVKLGGQLTEEEFKKYLPKTEALLLGVIAEQIPYWLVKPTLEEYEIDFSKILYLEIDFIDENGGLSVFSGQSAFQFKSASSEGISWEINTDKVEDYHGIPLCPLAMTLLKTELLISGLAVAPAW
ncbi:MAG: hypothetical protein J6D36_01770 [Erysipelotrichaceae bacterium]|nr:hypothetical protein [Erysipelotrichaceae bacterium]